MSPPDVPPAELVERAVEPVAGGDAVHSEAVAVDPARWELVRFTLWVQPPDERPPRAAYDVFHVASPHLTELATGRLW
ncbi:MAG: DUF4865 family protein [Actinomycetota bacterium]|nr:DUF4865 family protein [Actinomycetota bacterium]